MSDKLSKIVQWFLYILLGLSAVMGILFFTNTGGRVNLILCWGYFMFFLAIATLLLITGLNIMRNPKGSVKILIAIALMAVVFFISYSMSSNSFSPSQLEKMKITESTVRFVGAGLLILYVLGLGAIGVVIYTSIAKFLK
jgi:hypothetical protein